MRWVVAHYAAHTLNCQIPPWILDVNLALGMNSQGASKKPGVPKLLVHSWPIRTLPPLSASPTHYFSASSILHFPVLTITLLYQFSRKHLSQPLSDPFDPLPPSSWGPENGGGGKSPIDLWPEVFKKQS